VKELDDIWGGWFSGFTAGDGCFVIHKHNRDNLCASYRCQFQIALRDDDRAILEEIHETLGIGNIHDSPVDTCGFPNTKPQTRFQVHAIADCAELVKLFETYPLRAKKRRDFEIWRKAVAELQKPIDERDPLMLDYWFHKIKEVRQYETAEQLPEPIIVELQLTIKFEDEQ